MRGLAVVALVTTACSFTPGQVPSDSGIDGTPGVTVGFARTTTLADEESSLVAVRVVLSAPAESAVTVRFAIAGGTATRPGDFTTLAAEGTLTFAPGDVEEVVEIDIVADAADEADETVELALDSVTGPASLGGAAHTLTIAANALPRVTFALASTMALEATSPAIEVTLSKAPLIATSVSVSLDAATTATGGGIDFTFAPVTVTFAPGDTSETVALPIVDDGLDENDELAVLKLDTPVNVILGATTTSTHQIQDNDNPPTVAYAASSSSVDETQSGMFDVTVSLSAASGKDISIAYAVDGASTAAGTDYSVMTTSPLSFPAGTTSKVIRINVVQDTAIEGSETVLFTLGTLVNATLGAITSHTLTITDDDGSCYGTGAYSLCVAPQATDLTLPVSINTDLDPLCEANAPAGWTGQPNSCFIVRRNVTIAATSVTGNRPLVVLGTDSLHVTGVLDVASHRGGTTGPGAGSALCGAFTATPESTNNGAGGGAGGTFRSKGGNGGTGDSNSSNAGSSPAAVGAPSVLRSGCNGQNGGNGLANTAGGNAGLGGAGGGAVYLVTGGTLTIDPVATINASGAGAVAIDPNGNAAGGGGGGSGGMIKLHAAAFTVTGARLMANGGGGGGGGDTGNAGGSGDDPSVLTPTTPAAGGSTANGGADGGNGYAGATQAQGGDAGGQDNAGGGGGGGGGHIEANLPLAGATVSAGP